MPHKPPPHESPILAALREPPARAPGQRLWIALSGGLDSTVLLHAAHAAGLAPLHAVHVHHGLQAAADDWAAQCQRLCDSLGVPLHIAQVSVVDADGAGPEAAAREARYAALRACLEPGDVLATAHHAGDQAETVMLRVLRGTGIDGLAAMSRLSAFAPGLLWRPLLGLPRAQLLDYGLTRGLGWIEDPHNADPRYTRSWLRQELLPLVSLRLPGAEAALQRLAEHAREAGEALQELAAQDLQSAAVEGGGIGIDALLALSPARRRLCLRAWLARSGAQAPTALRITELAEALHSRRDGQLRLVIDATREVRRYRDALYCLAPLAPAPAGFTGLWSGAHPPALPADCGRLLSQQTPPQPLTVRFARGGERLQPQGAAHHRSLRNLFQEQGVPPWLRLRMPLIYQGDELVAVADRWQVEAFARQCLRAGFVYRWQPPWLGALDDRCPR